MPERPYSNQQRRGPAVAHLAWFTPEEYKKLLKAAKKPDVFDPDFETWHNSARERVKKAFSQGERIVKVPVDVDAFVAWCKKLKKEPNPESLDEFAELPSGE